MGNSVLTKIIFSQIPNNEYIHKKMLEKKQIKYLFSGHTYSIPFIEFRQESEVALLYFHGNASDLSEIHAHLDFLSKYYKINVFAFEYAGFGANLLDTHKDAKTATEKKIYKDANVFFDFLKTNFKEKNIILYGRSLGSSPCLYLASKNTDVGAVILESAFTQPIKTIGRKSAAIFNFSQRPIFHNEKFIETVQSPVLLLHGRADKLVPCKHSDDLKLYAINSKHVDIMHVKDADHNSMWSVAPKAILQKIKIFLEKNFLI